MVLIVLFPELPLLKSCYDRNNPLQLLRSFRVCHKMVTNVVFSPDDDCRRSQCMHERMLQHDALRMRPCQEDALPMRTLEADLKSTSRFFLMIIWEIPHLSVPWKGSGI